MTSRVHYRLSADDKAKRDRLFALVNRGQKEEARALMGECARDSPVLEELLEKSLRDNLPELLADVVSHLDDIDKRRFFWGRTAAILASEMDRPECLQTLVDLNADLNIADNDGETVILKICSLHGNSSTLNRALSAHPSSHNQSFPLFLGMLDPFSCAYDINHCNKDGQNAAAVAVINGNVHLLEMLWQRGCNMSLLDKRGNAPIHHACIKALPECLEKLLELGVDVNLRQRDSGDTPAHLAIMNPGSDFQYECLNVLVRHNADTTLVNTNSSSAILFQVTYPINAYDLAEIQRMRGFPHAKEVIDEARKLPVAPKDPLLDLTAGVSLSVSALASGAESAGVLLASPFVSFASLLTTPASTTSELEAPVPEVGVAPTPLGPTSSYAAVPDDLD